MLSSVLAFLLIFLLVLLFLFVLLFVIVFVFISVLIFVFSHGATPLSGFSINSISKNIQNKPIKTILVFVNQKII